jgi:hypothetical protein
MSGIGSRLRLPAPESPAATRSRGTFAATVATTCRTIAHPWGRAATERGSQCHRARTPVQHCCRVEVDDPMKPTVCAITRRLPVATAAGLTLLLGAAACSDSATSPVSAPVPTHTVTRPSTSAPTPDTHPPPGSTATSALYSLTVVNSFVRRPGDYLWIEGAVAEIVLKSSDSTRLTKIGRFGADVVFDDLEPGRYALRPAARPCSGTCDHLDGRTDQCEAVVDIPATARLTVEYTVGRTCAVRTS